MSLDKFQVGLMPDCLLHRHPGEVRGIIAELLQGLPSSVHKTEDRGVLSVSHAGRRALVYRERSMILSWNLTW